jgi:hypothetical protein
MSPPNLISDALPFGRLWYGDLIAISKDRLRKASQPPTSGCDSRLR